MNNWDRLVWNQRDVLWAGFQTTLQICAISFFWAIAVGLMLCLVRMYVRPLKPVAVVLIDDKRHRLPWRQFWERC